MRIALVTRTNLGRHSGNGYPVSEFNMDRKEIGVDPSEPPSPRSAGRGTLGRRDSGVPS